MSTAEALRDRANKVADVTRGQVHVYLRANDYLYAQARRRTASPQLPRKLNELKDKRTPSLRRGEFYSPAKLRETVHHRVEAARDRRAEFGTRGKQILRDWQSAVIVKDAKGLIKTVRQADGTGDLAKGLRGWVQEFPSKTGASASKPRRTKASATKRTATKPATTKSATRVTATQRAATKASS